MRFYKGVDCLRMIVMFSYCFSVDSSNDYEIDLPLEHVACYYNSHPRAASACRQHKQCPYKNVLNQTRCWGYESNCTSEHKYSRPFCDGNSKGWVKTKQDQENMFSKQADFGYIRERINELMVLCKPNNTNDSYLECTKYMRFCRARNIMFDFQTLLTIPEPMRYRDDVVREGQVGGHCKLKKKILKDEGQHKSPLQSCSFNQYKYINVTAAVGCSIGCGIRFAEMENFVELPYRPLEGKHCDTVIDKPTFIMKLDATVNMYHHFCDFVNLYTTLHLNDSFSTDVYVLVWDTIPYYSNFGVTWKAFTEHPLLNLGEFKGKKVCFRDAVFPLLPRMIFGMYYNMPLIPGCEGSSLFRAFSEHVRHRLKVQVFNPNGKVRVTLISRSTQYRRIRNEDELINSLKSYPDFSVRKVNFNRQMSFLQQLEVSYNTDILIGIHGAGLTHMLFMPVWGAVFEIYNCDDENCYADLARLKGLKYITWKKMDKIFPEDEGHHPTLGAHAKFTNYAFDTEEFTRLVLLARNHVLNHKDYVNRSKNCQEEDCDHLYLHDEF